MLRSIFPHPGIFITVQLTGGEFQALGFTIMKRS